MFINYFKSTFFSQYLVIVAIGILAWAPALIDPPAMPAPEGPVPLYAAIHDLLSPWPFLASLLGFILVLAQMYLLSNMLNRHELVLKNSSIAALVFLTMMSLFPDFLTLNPVMIVSGLIILVIYQMLIYYNKPDHLDRVFTAGFLISLGSLFYLPLTGWFVFVIISLLVCRAGYWQAWMAALIGFATPVIYLVAWNYWNDSLPELIGGYAAFFSGLPYMMQPARTDVYILGGYTILISLWGLFSGKGSDKAVETRAKSNVILWTIFFMIITLPLSGSLTLHHFCLTIPAMAMILTRALTSLRKTRMIEITLLIYLGMILTNNFLHNLLF